MHRRRFLRTSLLGLAALPASRALLRAGLPDDPPAFSGEAVFSHLLSTADARGWSILPIGQLVGAIGMELRGTPYVGATLELSEDREYCSVNLLGLDCVTFFESALGMAHIIKAGKRTSADLLAAVQHTRYRNGEVGDYTSRLHYTTDWFYDNARKGTVRMVTDELPGAEPFDGRVGFMSTHPQSYRQLKAHPELVPTIAKTEEEINARKIAYIPKGKVAAAEAQLQTGDILGITTTIKGIDCSHTGLCYRDDAGVLHFLHASLTEKKVILDTRLSTYLNGVSKHTGIMVARPLEPKTS